MDKLATAWIYWSAVGLIGLAIAWGGLSDLYLWRTGRPTITDLLRANPEWFAVPAVLLLLFVLSLTIHLYGGVNTR